MHFLLVFKIKIVKIQLIINISKHFSVLTLYIRQVHSADHDIESVPFPGVKLWQLMPSDMN